MPKQETLDAPSKLASPRPIRLFLEDDEALRQLHDDLDEDYDIDIAQFIRLCVRAGRPIIEAQFKAR
jgi:hypothetical protein